MYLSHSSEVVQRFEADTSHGRGYNFRLNELITLYLLGRETIPPNRVIVLSNIHVGVPISTKRLGLVARTRIFQITFPVVETFNSLTIKTYTLRHQR